jgi:hypothetical protein
MVPAVGRQPGETRPAPPSEQAGCLFVQDPAVFHLNKRTTLY